MTELNVFEDAQSGLIILEGEGRLVKATPQQAMNLMVSLSRRFGYTLIPAQQQEQAQAQQVEQTEETKQNEQPVEVEQENEEDETEEESDEEVEELFEDTPAQPTTPRVAVKKTLPPPPVPPRPLNVAKQVEAKMLSQRSPGKVGKSF